jgi:hypothetical protein
MELIEANRLHQSLFGGKEAVDIGARHAEPGGDVGDGRARAKFAEQIPGDDKDFLTGFLGSAARGDVHSWPEY